MPAPYALRAEESRGRRYPEEAHAYRNVFQRDRDRVVHSRAFRRLENKTQVFTGRRSDHFRNRLTHTIEVAQISRTIAAELQLNEDLVEALALVHDVGHPPFGHAGERVLNAAMQEYGDQFDHNLHALRTEYLLEQRPPLEAQLIDFTDEIAYSTADLDDGVEAKILTREQVRQNVPLFARLHAEVKQRFPAAAEKLLFNETLKRVLDRLVSDLIIHSRKLIGEAGVKSVEEVRRYPHRLIAFSPQVDEERSQIKEYLYANVYYSPAQQRDKQQAEKVIAEMFAFFMRFPRELPTSYQEKTRSEPLHRIVCDYVAGMTDSYIFEQHRRFCAPKKRIGV
jgi:dGTPase